MKVKRRAKRSAERSEDRSGTTCVKTPDGTHGVLRRARIEWSGEGLGEGRGARRQTLAAQGNARWSQRGIMVCPQNNETLVAGVFPKVHKNFTPLSESSWIWQPNFISKEVDNSVRSGAFW